MKIYCYIIILTAFLFVMGCAADVETFESSASLNQQLTDLEASYKAGAITENEYAKAKEIILKKYK